MTAENVVARVDANAAEAIKQQQPDAPIVAEKVGLVSDSDPQFRKQVTVRGQTSANVFVFPEELKQVQRPYIMFKIFETKTGDLPITDDTTQSIRQGSGAITRGVERAINAIPGGGSAVDLAMSAANTTAQFIEGAINGIDPTTGQPINIVQRAKDIVKGFNLKRNISQLDSTIVLLAPEGITTNYDHEYQAISVSAALGLPGLAAQAVSSVSGENKDALNPFLAEGAAALASRLLGNEDFAKLGLFATTGVVQNPQLEMIYSSPVLRKFVFDFRMLARNKKDSADIKRVINAFKFHSAPEVLKGSGGRYLIPPSQFEIEFFHNDKNNKFLFKTKKCVLTGMSVDYAPNGYATFYDGAPVEIRMQLSFQETSILSKNDFALESQTDLYNY